MRIRFLVTALLLIPVPEAHALQLVEVANGETVTVKVASRELTRIAMADGSRIGRVWGLAERMEVEADREGGQVFLRPAPGMPARAFSFFVRDDAGATYTLLAVPVDMPAETVLLRPKHRAARADAAASDHRALPHIEAIKRLVRAMARGAVPEGTLPAMEDQAIPLWAEARVVLIARYSGELTGEVYRLTNVSDTEMRLDEREVAALADDIEAVAVMNHALAPSESTRIYLVRAER